MKGALSEMEYCNSFSSLIEERVEIDTTQPFESVKAAVSMFGGVDLKKDRIWERRAAKGVELQQAMEELAKVREDLACAEKTKARALYEVAEANTLLEEMRNRLEEANGSNNRPRETCGATGVTSEQLNLKSVKEGEGHTAVDVELKLSEEERMRIVTELETAKQELEGLKQEILETLNEKEAAAKQAEETLLATEADARGVEELSDEISVSNESLVLVKLACIEANKERDALTAAREVRERKQQAADVETLKHELDVARELEFNLAAAIDELESLRIQFATAKEAEGKATVAAAEALANLDQARAEFERMRIAEVSSTSSLTLLSTELEVGKVNLDKALADGDSLRAEIKVIQNELEIMKNDLVDLREREANATAAADALAIELTRSKAELISATAAETRSVEAISGLSHALQQVLAEAEEVKAEVESMKEEACRARDDVVLAKTATKTAEENLQTASMGVEAAKVAETIALGQIRALHEKTNAARASEVDAGGRITISQDEYDALQRKMQEAEELASMRVAAVIAQVEAVKTSEQEIQQKLKTGIENVENIKKISKQALHQAEMAEAAKLAVESELRRLREKEQRRREREAISAIQQTYMRHGEDDQSISFSQLSQSEPLSKILNVKFPSPELGSKHVDGSFVQKKKKTKKKTFIPLFGGYLANKKNHVITDTPTSRMPKNL
eukprot:c28798_g1_i2 orf=669-2720(+)